MTAFPQPARSVPDLVRRASLDALAEAARAAHAAGDTWTRDALVERWHAALRAGVGWRPGIAALEHKP